MLNTCSEGSDADCRINHALSMITRVLECLVLVLVCLLRPQCGEQTFHIGLLAARGQTGLGGNDFNLKQSRCILDFHTYSNLFGFQISDFDLNQNYRCEISPGPEQKAGLLKIGASENKNSNFWTKYLQLKEAVLITGNQNNYNIVDYY